MLSKFRSRRSFEQSAGKPKYIRPVPRLSDILQSVRVMSASIRKAV